MQNKERFLNSEEIINSIEALMNIAVDTRITAQRIQQLCAFSTNDVAEQLYREQVRDWEIAQGYHQRVEENLFKINRRAA